ncbi:TPA: threonine-phosphate decarboxylase [bacterium]|nr:threonine-phosphate decarboxylase [bacterium]
MPCKTDDLSFLHGGDIYRIRRLYGKEPLDFSSNINPLGISKKVKDVILKNLKDITIYPDPGSYDLIKKIAEHHDIKEESILLGNGSSSLIYLIMNTLRPKKVAIFVPCFSEYERAALACSCKIKFVYLNENDGFNIPSLSKDMDTLFISNPNNPTGNLLIKERKIDLPKGLIVIDETYMDFLEDQKNHSFVSIAERDDRIVVIRSFTKFFAIPGLRLGYLVSHPSIINKLKANEPPWPINTFAQLAGCVLLDDKDYIQRTYRLIKKERDFLYDEISKIDGLKPYHSVANFILVKIKKDGIGSPMLADTLLKRGIYIRDCSNFRNLDSKCFRIGIRIHKDNMKLIEELNILFGGMIR